MMKDDVKLKVQDMPYSLREALLKRGHKDDEKITPRDAVGEWSAWHLGDAHWANKIIDLYENSKLLAARKEGE